MQILTLLMLQSTALPTTADGIRLDPVLPQRCADGGGDEIVVCGKRDDQRYRLPRLDTARFEPKRASKAEIGIIDGVNGAAEVESATMPNGQVSNRLMFRLKMPF